jgi:methyl-accepting chemotaxis protein
MLRSRLLMIMGPVVALLVASAVAAVWLLQGVLRDMRHIDTQAWVVVERTNAFSTTVNSIEAQLYRLQLQRDRHVDRLIDSVEEAQQLLGGVGESYVVHEPGAQPWFDRISNLMPEFERHVGALATAQDPQLAHLEASLTLAAQLREQTLPLSRFIHDHARTEQNALIDHFRSLVLGISLVFVVVINLSILGLLRVASMITRPVDQLLEGARQLGQERFDHRVKLPGNDEFGQLAQAYNRMAEQLQASEQRKMDTLAHVALTMNHELNNTISIIQLQLRLIDRRIGGNDVALAKSLMQIRDSLNRMASTVDALKHVRRIVLTDYMPGTKMLDLRKSVDVDADNDADAAAAGSSHKPAALTVAAAAGKTEGSAE